MDRHSRLALVVAAGVSVPLVAAALWGAVYIAYSLAAQSWYRSMFWAYGTKLLVLYAIFAAGVAAAASIALQFPQRPRRTTRFALIAASIAGVVAAALLEFVFWSDDDRLVPRGLLLLPFVGWAIVAATARRAARAGGG